MIPGMTSSDNCFNLIEQFECSGDVDKYLTAYQCSAGKWTIGMGNTYYADGSLVKKGDVLTHDAAVRLYYDVIPLYEAIVNKYILKELSQNQFDALVSFVYNVPRDAFSKSTLVKLINSNPDDVDIKGEWLRWVYFTNPKTGQKEVSQGLLNRRKAESGLYFS